MIVDQGQCWIWYSSQLVEQMLVMGDQCFVFFCIVELGEFVDVGISYEVGCFG